MTSLWTIFRAGLVRRWHANPDMADVRDTLAEHQGRCARLALRLFPGDNDLIAMALTHDDGETATGDIPYDVKEKMGHDAYLALRHMEEGRREDMWGEVFNKHVKAFTSQSTAIRMHLIDRLDPIMVVAHNKPWLLRRADWQHSIAEVLDMAIDLGVAGPVRDALNEAEAMGRRE